MILLNLIFHYAALLVATGIFFGLWLLPLGYLALKSGYFPPLLGTFLIVAGGAWVVDTLVRFIAPDLSESIHFVMTLPLPSPSLRYCSICSSVACELRPVSLLSR